MTCQCTCGKHMLVEFKPFGPYALAAAAAAPQPAISVVYANTADFPSIVHFEQDTAGAAQGLTLGPGIRVVP